MGLKDRFNKAMAKQAEGSYKELLKTFQSFEDHLIQIQKNQVEFEEYLKDIKNKLENE